MPRFFGLGFLFGPASPSVATAPAVPASGLTWTALSPFAGNWAISRTLATFPRFERIFPLPPLPQPGFARPVYMVYHVQSQFPFLIGATNDVRLYSVVTVP